MMFISKERYEKMVKLISDQSALLERQNKTLHRLNEEVKQLSKLNGLYEACITKGVKIDFPDVTGGKKGEEFKPGNDIDFNY